MNGYWNKVLRVNLSKKRVKEEKVKDIVWRKLIGGSGYGAYILYKEVPKNISALEPENKIIFATGPYQASNLPGAAKWQVISKSPLNNYYGESAAGADWGINLKRAGYDAVIIEGRAGRPIYLEISDEEVKLKDAEKIWGKDAYETVDILKEDFKLKDYSIATIGLAGENKVKFASIIVDKHSVAGRMGLGAVLGSKKLKAIVVRGEQRPEIAEPDKLKEFKAKLVKKISKETSAFREHGTPGSLSRYEKLGDIPVKNWRKDSFKGYEKISAPKYTEELHARPQACMYCPVGCHRHVRVEEPKEYKMEGAGPEYETLGMLGENCLTDNLKAISKANDLCNRYGIDTIQIGGITSYLMECQERGYIDKGKIGLDLSWGNADAVIELLNLVANRKGFGNILAEGLDAAIKNIGLETEKYTVHVKGVMLPAHDPRAWFGVGLNYATGVCGPGHERGNLQFLYLGTLMPEMGIYKPPEKYTMEGTESFVPIYQDWSSLWNSLVICRFMTVGGVRLKDMVDALNMITGWELDIYDIMKAGQRIFNLQRLVNVKYGVSRKNDKLPRRIFEPVKKGPHEGKVPEPFESTLERYYEIRGWDKNGKPTREKLRRLGLHELVDID